MYLKIFFLINFSLILGCAGPDTPPVVDPMPDQTAVQVVNPYPNQCPLAASASQLIEFYNGPFRDPAQASDTHYIRVNSDSCTIKSASWEAHYVRPEDSTNQVQSSEISGDNKEASVVVSIHYPPLHRTDDYLLTLTITLENQALGWISPQSQYPLDINVER